MKKLFTFLFLLLSIGSLAQTRDSIVCKDSTIKSKVAIITTTYADSPIKVCSTYQVPVIVDANRIIQAHYLNGLSAWFYNGTSQDNMIKWLLSNGDNRVYIYGIDGVLTSNYSLAARFNDSCSAHNIETYFVWSRPTSVTTDLANFQKAQTKQSSKFDGVISELEPYNNTVSYTLFWSYSRSVYNYTKANGIQSGVYVGWHTQQSTDSIVTTYDFVNLHCYVQPVNMTSSTYLYGYTKSRMEMFASSVSRLLPNKTFPVTIIFSDETAFAFSYYQSTKGNFALPFTTYSSGFNIGASAIVKSKLILKGSTTFVSSYSLQIKPLPTNATMRMASMQKNVLGGVSRKLLYVSEKDNSINTIDITTPIY